MAKIDKNMDLEVVKVGFANGVVEGFPLNDKEKNNKKLFEELSFYDQLVSTVGRGFVCAKCLDKDNINWVKYRKNEKIIK